MNPRESYAELVRRRGRVLVAAGVPFAQAIEIAQEQAHLNILQRHGSLVERMRAAAEGMKHGRNR